MEQRNINLENIFTTQNIIIYFVIINVIGFFIMWLDKRKARKGSWRIPEKTLFIISPRGNHVSFLPRRRI